MAKLTSHGAKRLRRRVKTGMCSDKQYLEKVIKYGLLEKEAAGDLKHFMRAKAMNNGFSYVYRIYNQAMHVFANNNTLVTVYRLPKELISCADMQAAQKHRSVDEEDERRRQLRRQKSAEYWAGKKKLNRLIEYEREINLRF